MTDDSLDRNSPTLDAPAFFEWLDEIATAKEVSREELLQTLISSYWTVDEMFRLIEDGAPRSNPLAPDGPNRTGSPPRSLESRPEDVEREHAASLQDLDDRIRYLRGELRELSDDRTGGTDSERVAALESRLSAIERALDESRRAPSVGEDEIEDLKSRVDAVAASLSSGQDALSARVNTEFGYLHTILEHLIETTEALDGRTDRLEERLDRAPRMVRPAHDRLTGIKRTAARLGVTEARCASCDTTVDIALLPTADCPVCERPLADVEPKRGWFGSPTLTVAPDEGAGPEEDDRIGGFEWIDG